MALFKKQLEKQVNVVGAQEVDALKIKKLTGWSAVKGFARSKKVRGFLWAIIRSVLLIGLCWLIIYPMFVQLTTSLKTAQDVYDQTVIFIPRNITLSNYVAMWNHLHIPTLFINSVLSSLVLGTLQMASCTLVAYGLARFKFKGNSLVFFMVIATLIIPVQLMADTMKMRYSNFNPLTMFSMRPECFNASSVESDIAGIKLVGGWPILIAMSATCVMFKNGLFIFLLRQYFRNQPKELEEAAYIDGAGTFRTFWQVMLPSALPLMVTVFLFAFVWQYNDNWYLSMLYPNADVLSQKISGAAQGYVQNVLKQPNNSALVEIYNGALLMMHVLPLVVLYVFCQRFFVESIERSGMVG